MTSFSLKPGNKKPNVTTMPKLSIFQQADEEESKPQSKPLSFQQAKAGGAGFLQGLTYSSRDKVAEEASKHLLEDADVFEYDKFVDQYQSKREALVEEKKERISSAVEKRKREQTIIQERIAEKEIQRENDQFGDKERFVTSSYLKMMQENKKFEEEERQKEAYDKAHSINNEDNLGGFFKNMYKNDIFAGGHRPDLSKEPTKPEEKKAPVNVPTQGGRGAAPIDQPKTREPPKDQTGSNDIKPKVIEEFDPDTVRAPIDISKNATELKPVRERSRSKSKERNQQTAALEKPQETAETRYDKAKSAKERYLQRKQQEQAKGNEDHKPADTK